VVRALKPTREEIAAAHGKTIDDVIKPGLTVLFCGINPGLYSAAVNRHFARPGNRFWPALYRGGFTPRQLRATEQWELLDYGLGITNLVARGTARADELTRAEIVAGGEALVAKVLEYQPAWVAVLGITAYRSAFGSRTVHIGQQSGALGGANVWVLPNPSGLNAHFQLDDLAAEFAKLHAATLC